MNATMMLITDRNAMRDLRGARSTRLRRLGARSRRRDARRSGASRRAAARL